MKSNVKALILILLVLISILLEIIVHWGLHIEVVYSHFFYVPVVLAAILYGKKGVVVAIFLGGLHIASSFFITGGVDSGAVIRGVMLVLVGLLTGAIVDAMTERRVLAVRGPPPRIPGLRGGVQQVRCVLASYRNVKRLKEKRDVDALICTLCDKDVTVQYEATEALGDLRDHRAIGPLMALLTGDEYTSIRWKAAEALAKIGTPAVEPLITALSHQNDDVRWKAAIALGEIGDGRAIHPLIELLKDNDRFIKGRAAYALGKIGSPAVIPLIIALDTGDGSLRWGAAIALGKIRDERAIRPLIRALGDRYENVRSEAVAALGVFGDAILDPILDALQQPDLFERLKLATTIAEASRSTLGRILAGADPEYRKKLTASLLELNSAGLGPFIRVLTGER